jgi:hypothetical protein
VPSKSALNLGSNWLSAFSWDLPSDDNNIENLENETVGQEPLSMADELSMSHKESNNFSRIKNLLFSRKLEKEHKILNYFMLD